MSLKAPALPVERLVPLIVATALFMQNLDSTVLSTSLPAIAVDLGENPIHLKLALTSYLLAIAVFIPASGWMADRFGARTVFRCAMAVFALGSLCCGLSSELSSLVLARVLQGVGGAMMVPVGRLVVLRTVERSDIVNAMAWLSIPALLGPIMGPPLGGFITTYFNWRWIFWINIPMAVVGIVLATLYIPEITINERVKFDALGFVLVGPGLAAFVTGGTLAGLGLIPGWAVALLTAGGAVLLFAYVHHAFSIEAPLIDLRLLRLNTFRASVIGGFLFRVGVGATPFLLPLLLQTGFGLSAFNSGLLTFVAGVGALVMKTLAAPILRRFGFRRVLIANALVSSIFVGIPAFFSVHTPWFLISIALLIGGFLRSLQFTSINAVAYADVPSLHLSRATSFAAVLQELSGSVGVSIAALGLQAASVALGGDVLAAEHFPFVFALIAAISLASVAVFWWELPAGAGDNLVSGRVAEAAGPDDALPGGPVTQPAAVALKNAPSKV